MAFSDRMQWSINMQKEHALDYYHDFWDVEEIDEVDAEGEEHDGFKRLDFSGIDKIIHTQTQTIHVAQRFRQMRNLKTGLETPDFSLRYETYNDKPTEYQKLKESYNGLGNTPNVYGFGVSPYGRQVGMNDGFEEFYLIDMDQFLQSHFDDSELPEIGKIPNGDNSTGIYFDLEELDMKNCILKHWEEPIKPSRPEDPHDITNWADD
jgi:hypothetical protein